MRYLDEPAETAARTVIDGVTRAGASGGLVGLNRDGQPFAAFNTSGMYRGWITPNGELALGIFGDESKAN